MPDDGGGEFALVVVPERVRPETLVHLLKGQPGAFGFLLGRVRAVALAPGVVPGYAAQERRPVHGMPISSMSPAIVDAKMKARQMCPRP